MIRYTTPLRDDEPEIHPDEMDRLDREDAVSFYALAAIGAVVAFLAILAAGLVCSLISWAAAGFPS